MEILIYSTMKAVRRASMTYCFLPRPFISSSKRSSSAFFHISSQDKRDIPRRFKTIFARQNTALSAQHANQTFNSASMRNIMHRASGKVHRGSESWPCTANLRSSRLNPSFSFGDQERSVSKSAHISPDDDENLPLSRNVGMFFDKAAALLEAKVVEEFK